MESILHSVSITEQLPYPAFIVKDGIITEVNSAAQERQLPVGTNINTLIYSGLEDYAQYTSGKLFVQLRIDKVFCDASVTKVDDMHLFCLESGYASSELRVLALAAQQLKEPLTNAIANADRLLHSSIVQTNPEIKTQLGQLNHGLYQLTRSVGNMADAGLSSRNHLLKIETQDAGAVFSEIMSKATAVANHTDRTLVFKNLIKATDCAMDYELIERAVLNLISNALKFSPKGSSVSATLRRAGGRLCFSIENTNDNAHSSMYNHIFARYLREPGVEDGRFGIGLGMSIVRAAAAIHNGAVLVNSTAKKTKITLSISLQQKSSNMLRSPIQLIGGYTGGWDNLMIELSDVLPASLFEEI